MSLFTSFIKHQKPFCNHCVNYIINKPPYAKLYDNEIGMCLLFKQNIGKTEYEDILTCRLDNSKCGVKGRFYKKNKQYSTYLF